MILSSVICCALFIPVFIYLQYVIMLCGSLLATIAAMLSAQLLLLTHPPPPLSFSLSSFSSTSLFFSSFSSLSYFHYYYYYHHPQHVLPKEHTTKTHTVTDHMMGHHNIYAIHLDHFLWSLIHSKSKSSVCHMLSEFCCLVALCFIVTACPFIFPRQQFHRAYLQPCMTLNCFFLLSTYITENMVTEATMAIRVWRFCTKGVILSSFFLSECCLTPKTLNHLLD